MAAAEAMTNRHIVSTILHQLSDMKYKDRRQRGADQPVELLEFRPTLVPCILVNQLWADEGTTVLWKRYPHLPQFRGMDPTRRQYYANKVQCLFTISPSSGVAESLEYLDGLKWPNLKSLELEIDFKLLGAKFQSMLHTQLENFELSGLQSGGSAYFSEKGLPSLFSSCRNLKSIRFGPALFSEDDPVHASVLFDHLQSLPSIRTIDIKSAGFTGVSSLFIRLSQRSNLESLELDMEPGLALLPLLQSPNALPPPFASLKRLTMMCYPEIALALVKHLPLLEEMQLDVCRIPNQSTTGPDYVLLEDLFEQLSSCPRLQLLKVGIGALTMDFPSIKSLPKLSGTALVRLATSCPRLEDLNIYVNEPSALDGSLISTGQFDTFCTALPHLVNLSLKLHPATTSPLEETAMQSLATHCHELKVIRLKIPCRLPALPVPDTVPEILVSSPPSLAAMQPIDPQIPPRSPISIVRDDSHSPAEGLSRTSSFAPVPALFPHVTHLAISRPLTALAISDDSFTGSSFSRSDIVDPELEEELVRTWAHTLFTHFPRLEVLEAWGDSTGQDNESLNYFLPLEELLATTWEFLTGAEQDVWSDEDEEADSWQTYEGSVDWEAASYLNEFVPDDGADGLAAGYHEEPEGTITPGRTVDGEEYFDLTSAKTAPYSVNRGSHPEVHTARDSIPKAPAEEIAALSLS